MYKAYIDTQGMSSGNVFFLIFFTVEEHVSLFSEILYLFLQIEFAICGSTESRPPSKISMQR